jgi:uncharacterized protein (TIGR03083 family)
VTDDSELAGIDPFDLLDREAARLDSHLATLSGADWTRPSRCAGWSTREVLAHLASSEDYNRACLDGTVRAFLEDLGARGATDLDSANALGVAELADLGPQEVLARWREANASNRVRLRERGDGLVDTTVGDYPCRWQAFHLASELATHADDISVPVTSDERDERGRWRARFSRFALVEAKPDVTVSVEGGRTGVSGKGVEVVVDDDDLVEGVAGRLDDGSALPAPARALLSTME